MKAAVSLMLPFSAAAGFLSLIAVLSERFGLTLQHPYLV